MWRTVKLGDVCKIVNGGTPKSNVKNYWDGNVQWLTPKDMGKLKDRYVASTERTITAEGLENSSAKLVPKNSVILSCRAPIGHVVINECEMSFNQGCKGLIPASTLAVEYLYYFLFASKQLLNDLGTGTTFKEISGKTLASVEITLPPLAEQQRIVAKLDAAFAEIDRAIELTKIQQISTSNVFEKQIRRYFEENVLDANFARLSEVAEYFNGLTYTPEDVSHDGTIVLRSSNVQDGRLDLSDLVRVKVKIKEKLMVKPSDILICSRNGSKNLIGKSALIGENSEDMTFGTFMMIVRSELNEYLQWFFKSSLFKQQIAQGEHTAINQITRYMLDEVIVPVPSAEECFMVAKQLLVLDENIREILLLLRKKRQELSSLKSAILAQELQPSEAA
jgi:type I restriction enzyme, S subunit